MSGRNSLQPILLARRLAFGYSDRAWGVPKVRACTEYGGRCQHSCPGENRIGSTPPSSTRFCWAEVLLMAAIPGTTALKSGAIAKAVDAEEWSNWSGPLSATSVFPTVHPAGLHACPGGSFDGFIYESAVQPHDWSEARSFARRSSLLIYHHISK